MIVIVGESGCGKTTIQNKMCEIYGYKKIISYTTRPPRNGEVNGVDYHFISEDEFIKKIEDGFFAEHALYRGWFYGTAKKDCLNNKIAVLTPHGLRQMKNYEELEIYSFYIKVPRKDRLIKLLERGDDIEEAYRRNLSDVGQFDGIEDEVDWIVYNDNYKHKASDIASNILLHVLMVDCL